MEAAVPNALECGRFFLTNIKHNQVDIAGLTLLYFLAAQGEGAVTCHKALASQLDNPDKLDQTLSLLTQRDLIETAKGDYCFQVELIRRWFAQNVY